LRSQVYQSKGESAAAEAELRKASAAEDAAWPDPMAAEVVSLRTGLRAALARADRMLAAERPDEALKALEGAKGAYPDSDWVWLLLGRAYFQKRDLAAAEQALREAVRLGPRSDKAQFHLGLVHYFQKDYRAAADCFRTATQIKPDFAQAHYNLGNCLLELRDRAGARKAFEAAVNCKPDYVNALVDLGELLAEEGKVPESLAHLRQAVQFKPEDKRAQEALEKALKRQTGPAKP
jgi:tetratricopeptide (TPR) repeat protein